MASEFYRYFYFRFSVAFRSKMKLKRLLASLALVTSSLVFVQPAANANCTESDPCGGWAVVDSQGTITNIIVCQASVCGGGRLGDLTVVPQVAPNPITHNTEARGGSWGTYDQQSQVFTVDRSAPDITPEVYSDTDNNGVKVSVEVPRPGYQFKYSDTIQSTYDLNRSYEVPVSLPENTKAKVSAEYQYLDENEDEQKYSESYTFNKRQTEEEVNIALVRERMELLITNINRILSKLNKWLK
jgi:hypothetical protein